MEITKILSGMQNQTSAPASSSAIGAQTQTPSPVNVATKQAQAPTALSSKYTYAIGNDGRRYVLQLRIDVVRLDNVSELA